MRAIKMAVTARGGKAAIWREDEAARVIFHTDRGSTYTANSFTKLCQQLGVRQSMGRVGSCFDNAAAEAFFSSLEWEVLSRHDFESTRQAQAVVLDWCYAFYNHDRRHSSAGNDEPDQLREHRGPRPGSRIGKPSTIRGEPHHRPRRDSDPRGARRRWPETAVRDSR